MSPREQPEAKTAVVGAGASGPAAKRELLRSLLRSGGGPEMRLSEAQARLWEIERRENTPGVHDFSLAYFLSGPLDIHALEGAFAAVAARHLVLRCRISGTDGVFCFEQIPGLPFEQRLADPGVSDLMHAEAARPLDPRNGHGWRAVLFRSSAEEHALVLHFHHVFADRWSVANFITDFAEAYRALHEGRQPVLPPAPRSVADAPVWEADLDYWRRVFARPPEPLKLPFAQPGQAFPGYAGGRVEFEIGEADTEALKAAAAAQSSTLFAALVAGFAAFLHAHTGQEDVVLCTSMVGRHHAGARSLIGYFNNILPLRLDLSGDPEFERVLSAAAVGVREIYAAQDVPFHRIASLPELAGNRITQCLVTLQNIPGLELQLPGIVSSYRDLPNGTANFDMALFAEENAGRLRCLFDYKAAFLDRAEAELMRERLISFLRAAAGRRGERLSLLPHYAAPDRPKGTANASPLPPARFLSVADEKMLDLWREVFSQSPRSLDANSDFFALGGDSMKAARLFALVGREFSVDLPLATLFEAPTPRQLVRCIAGRDWVAPWVSLVSIQPAGSRPPLFLVHGGAGNVISFRFVADCLQDRPVYGLQAHGLKAGSQPLETIEEMATHYLQSVRSVWPHGPYLLAGHSAGAAVAYEMAQRLMAEEEGVPFLGLLDHPGPNMRVSYLDALRLRLSVLATLSYRERWIYFQRALIWRREWLLARWHIRKSPLRLEKAAGGSVYVLEQSLRALQNYQIRPYPGRLTLFHARQGDLSIQSDECGGWSGVVAGGVEMVEVPGGHMSMFEQPHVTGLGKAIGRCLDQLH
jgi:thioesterase domain-containing protein